MHISSLKKYYQWKVDGSEEMADYQEEDQHRDVVFDICWTCGGCSCPPLHPTSHPLSIADATHPYLLSIT